MLRRHFQFWQKSIIFYFENAERKEYYDIFLVRKNSNYLKLRFGFQVPKMSFDRIDDVGHRESPTNLMQKVQCSPAAS